MPMGDVPVRMRLLLLGRASAGSFRRIWDKTCGEPKNVRITFAAFDGRYLPCIAWFPLCIFLQAGHSSGILMSGNREANTTASVVNPVGTGLARKGQLIITLALLDYRCQITMNTAIEIAMTATPRISR